jgi:peptidoglycan/LPS O-acetylase OafA/YrhL
MTHRRDIDGLRALAIVPVVLGHARVPGFAGGFVGVDVFFVVSGFLITALIAHELQAGSFSLSGFYLRRARRILPALIAVLAATLFVGCFMLTPGELRDVGRLVLASSLFLSNVALWQQSGYFDAALELKPLLMTWSLGIEEQFYLFWPLALGAMIRWRASPLRWTGAVAVISFGLATWACNSHPSAAFFLLPTRAWELLGGSALALAHRPSVRPESSNVQTRHLMSWLGLALVAVSMATLDRHSSVPGWAALAPCAGTVLLLHAGPHAWPNRFILASKPAVFIGLISYSLYLWHWPLLTFARVYTGPDELRPTQVAALVASAMVLAYASWRWIETPWRLGASRSRGSSLRRYAALLATSTLLGTFTYAGSGFPSRVQHEYAAVPVNDPPIFPSSTPLRPARVGLWGDSQALALTPGLASWAARRNEAIFLKTHNSCPPVDGIDIVFDGRTFAFCREFNRAALADYAANANIHVVVLAARWAWYAQTRDFVFDRHTAQLISRANAPLAPAESQAAMLEGLTRTVNALQAAGKRVVLLDQVPELGFDPAACLTRRELFSGWIEWPPCSVSAQTAALRMEPSSRVLRDVARATGSQYVGTTGAFCDAGRCEALRNQALRYSDDNHVSPEGADVLAQLIGPRLAAVVGDANKECDACAESLAGK